MMSKNKLTKSSFFAIILIFTLVISADGCNNTSVSRVSTESTPAAFDPCELARQIDPHCGWKPHWVVSGESVNQMDGVKTEFIEMDSSDADSTDFGKLHYSSLRLCFENGKLCGGDSVAVGIKAHGMIDPVYGEEYSTRIRYKFDNGSPIRATWGISDSHETLFPSGHEKQFASELLKHKKLLIEFSYYEKSPITVNFDLDGLEGALKSSGLTI